MPTLLIVEDDAGLREQMKWAFREGFDVLEADSLEGALEAARGAGEPALVCLDMGLEGRFDRGLDVLDALLARDPSCKVVAVTGSRDEALGREAIRRGAFDFLRKPADTDALRMLFERAERIRALEEEPSWSAVPDGGEPAHDGSVEPGIGALIGDGDAIRRVHAALRRLAPASADVLFTGEAGTGRESAARALHALGPRKDGPFVAVPCAGIPEEVLEAELFGRPEDFPGAPEAGTPGAAAMAEGGTLFLDGIEDLPPSLQGRLLRWLHDGSVPGRPGPSDPGKVRPRLMASATRDPGAPGFRSDLLRRLGEFEIALPPLRDRGRDALLIAQALVARNRPRFRAPRLRLGARAEKALLAHGWPGHVRELEDRLNRASLSCRAQVIDAADLGLDAVDEGLSYRERKHVFERTLLMDALKKAGGNVSLAARTLGVTRPTLYDMMRKNGIEVRVEAKI